MSPPQPHDITNSIATADHVARLAGLPTYTELAEYLEKVIEFADPRTPENIKDLKHAVTLTCRIPS